MSVYDETWKRVQILAITLGSASEGGDFDKAETLAAALKKAEGR